MSSRNKTYQFSLILRINKNIKREEIKENKTKAMIPNSYIRLSLSQNASPYAKKERGINNRNRIYKQYHNKYTFHNSV